MKFLLATVLMISSINVFACPNLTGDYFLCTTGDLNTDLDLELSPFLSISQTGKEVQILDDTGVENITLDKVDVQTWTEDGMVYTLTVHPVCVNSQKIQITSSAEIQLSDGTVFTTEPTQSYVKTTSEGLEYSTWLEVYDDSGNTTRTDHIVKCKKK